MQDPEATGEVTAQGEALVEPDLSEANFVILHHLNSPIEAEMVNDILRQNNIRSVMKSAGMDAFSALSTSASGAMVLVDERDYDRAQELYSAFFGEDTSPLTGPSSDDEDNGEAE